MREVTLERNTNETQIELTPNLDGAGRYEVDTGCGFLNHMLELFARHGRFDLVLTCHGDVEVDYHHTAEDIGIALGQAFARALGEMRGIQRYGSFYLPMDEALVLCAVDLSGRCTLNWDMSTARPKRWAISTWSAPRNSGWALPAACPATVHFVQFAGENSHHILEAAFKGAGRALADAVRHRRGPSGRNSLPRKDCWYDMHHRLRRGQPVQPEIESGPSGAGSEGQRGRRRHPRR